MGFLPPINAAEVTIKMFPSPLPAPAVFKQSPACHLAGCRGGLPWGAVSVATMGSVKLHAGETCTQRIVQLVVQSPTVPTVMTGGKG